MNVACDKCGATYQIDPAKMKADVVRFACKTCGDYVIVNKKTSFEGPSIPSEPTPPSKTPQKSYSEPAASVSKVKGFGIRTKMIALLVVFVVAFAGQAYYLISELNNMTERFGEKGIEIIKNLAETDIVNTANSVANQVNLYLRSHPELVKEDFLKDEEFKTVAIQPVGKSGYTALYEKGVDGVFRTWAHTRPNICAPNLDDMSKLKKPMGKNFDEFWKILTGVDGNKSSKGYYRWHEKDKTIKDKFMACVNVKGTRFYIASTTYIDEFTLPMNSLESQSREIARAESINIGVIITVVSIIIAVVVSILGHRLTSNIRYLCDVTDRISLGDLDLLIETRSSDELAVLTESISRLQQSVRLSIQRLRK